MAEHETSPPKKAGTQQEQNLLKQIRTKEGRKLRARQEQHSTIWFWLGMIGLVGWSVALPTIIGVAVGVWVDRTWPSRYSWTLMFLFVGIVIGCTNAWFWVQQESGNK